MPSVPLPPPARENIDLIARVEREFQSQRSPAERLGGAVARFFGSVWFILAHAAIITVWVAVNARRFGVEPFDPYPFPLLALVVGVEFILLTTFVLMNQDHLARRQEHWAHLTLQVALLAEREATKTMQVMHQFGQKLGLDMPAADAEMHELAKETSVAALAEEVGKSRGGGDGE